MTAQTVILIAAGIMLAVGLLTVLAWFIYTSYLDAVERRLDQRKGLYRELVSELATRDRALLEGTIHQLSTLYDLDALEAVLEEQARSATGRPGWLLEVYDRLGLVDKYIEKLRSARKWRDRAFAAELLGRVGGAKAVPALLETVNATRTEDSDVREIALRALARIADPGAVGPLIRALATADVWLAPRIADILARHGDLVVDPLTDVLTGSSRHLARAWAANVLGEVRALRAFPVLVRALGASEDEVRAKAATALGRLGDRRAIGPLMQHLLTDPAPFVRLRIASSLGEFGGSEVIDRLVRALGDPAWWVRMRSVEALEQVGSVAEAPLMVALDDADAEIRLRAAAALERLGVPDKLVRMIEAGDAVSEASEMLVKFARAGARELLAELVVHPSPGVRRSVVTAIELAGRGDLASPLILMASGDRDASVRAAALESLRSLRDPHGVPPALAALTDSDPGVRAAAIGLLGELGGPEVLGLLRDQTLDRDPAVRVAAAGALGALGADVAERDFLRLLGDPKPEVREAAVVAVVDAGLKSLAPVLMEMLEDPDVRVRRQAARALGSLGDHSMAPVLLRRLPEAEDDVRDAIVVAVSRLDLGAMTGLMETIADSLDADTKLALIRTLRRPRTQDALELLEQLSYDPDPVVRAAAIKASGRGGRTIARGLRDPEEVVRAGAVDSVGRSGGEQHRHDVLSLLRSDPAPAVRERAAVAVGLLQLPLGEETLRAACRRSEPPNVRAAAALALAAYGRESLIARVMEMPDADGIREVLRARLTSDAGFRLLGRRLSSARRLELRALRAPTVGEAQALAEGMRGILDVGERVRLIASLRAFQGERSRHALLEIIRTDPTPEVRTAALFTVGDLLDTDELLSVGARALGDPSLLVRRAAVGLFTRVPPDRGLARLIQVLRGDDDPAVLAAAAGLAEEHFPSFAEAAQRLPLDAERTVLVVRVARYIHHVDLPAVLSPLARNAAPEVREAVADLWRQRPEVTDQVALDALATDPVGSVRRKVAAAAISAGRYDILDLMTQDPDPGVRREVAVVLGRAAPVRQAGLSILEGLAGDSDVTVRAAAYVARLLQGDPLPLPPGLDGPVVAEAVLAGADLQSLRRTARSAPGEQERLAAALALALVQDEVAWEVARTDPAPSIRHRVGGALELSMVHGAGVST